MKRLCDWMQCFFFVLLSDADKSVNWLDKDKTLSNMTKTTNLNKELSSETSWVPILFNHSIEQLNNCI